MSDFSWNGDDAETIVLGWQPRTAVYVAQSGGVAIRQERECGGEDRDDLIALTPMGALQVAWKLIELAHAIGIPKPDRRLLAKVVDAGPSHPPQPLPSANQSEGEPRPLLEAMQRESAA